MLEEEGGKGGVVVVVVAVGCGGGLISGLIWHNGLAKVGFGFVWFIRHLRQWPCCDVKADRLLVATISAVIQKQCWGKDVHNCKKWSLLKQLLISNAPKAPEAIRVTWISIMKCRDQ